MSRAFERFFSDPLLRSMFGPAATQHARPGSYPAYFQRAFEDGLTREGAVDNPFLHHVFLGHYLDREGCLPPFLAAPVPELRITFREGCIDAQLDLSGYGFVDLSNILDWMDTDQVGALLDKLCRESQPGTVVMWRQLNNARDLEAGLRGDFVFDAAWQRSLRARDRSLFYSSVHVGVRR